MPKKNRVRNAVRKLADDVVATLRKKKRADARVIVPRKRGDGKLGFPKSGGGRVYVHPSQVQY